MSGTELLDSKVFPTHPAKHIKLMTVLTSKPLRRTNNQITRWRNHALVSVDATVRH